MWARIAHPRQRCLRASSGDKVALAVGARGDKINLISFTGLRRQDAVCETGADV
jgi:hypothetical protein